MKTKIQRGLLAFTLMLGMAFAVPQQAVASEHRTNWPDGSYTVYSYAGNDLVICKKYDRHGKLLRMWFVRPTSAESITR